MKFADAIREHRLDVAAFEIRDMREQYGNLHKWLSQVDADERAKADELLARAKAITENA